MGYPDGSKSNNTVITTSSAGLITQIKPIEKRGGFQVFVETKDGSTVIETVPPGPELVKVGQSIRIDEPLTNNPNVGGFAQAETEIVLLSAGRIQALLAFCTTIILTQIILVLKKKQFEKVQLSEIKF